MKMHYLASITIAAILSFAVAAPAFAQSEEHVQFAANIEFIKGHLEQAVANKQAGNNELATAHAGHPVAEVYSLIKGEIKENDAELDAQLEESLTSLANQINTMTPAQVQAKASEINTMLDQAETSVISESERNDSKFNGMVAITVLETATNEYEEAIEDGKIAEMIEYQDSTAFIARAETIFNSIKAELPEHGAEELAEFFVNLDSQTEAAASFEEVKTTINGIIHEFEEVLELESDGEKKLDGWGYIDRIKELLDKSVAEYKEGNAQEAKSLATEAYLDNYEFIEADIAQENKELMEKIEIDMRVELIQMIDAGKPAAEVESHVDAIKTDLETARTVVTPEFPLAAAVLASVAATILAGTLYTRRKGLASF